MIDSYYSSMGICLCVIKCLCRKRPVLFHNRVQPVLLMMRSNFSRNPSPLGFPEIQIKNLVLQTCLNHRYIIRIKGAVGWNEVVINFMNLVIGYELHRSSRDNKFKNMITVGVILAVIPVIIIAPGIVGSFRIYSIKSKTSL